MAEAFQAFQWAVSTMQADSALMAAATGGVYQDIAPLNTLPPIVIVGCQAGTDVLTGNAVRLWTKLIFQIKAIGPATNYGALVTIANRIDALFGRVGPISLAPGTVMCCYRETELAISELVNGQQWSHLGGLYTIQLQGS